MTSNSIAPHGNTRNINDRFWAKVEKTDNCWEWIGSKNNYGYGKIILLRKLISAHRLSWIIHNGDIPEGSHYGTVCVLHKCDNPSCVNPDHLFLGTHSENMQDMLKKNRGAKQVGEEASNSKLNSSQVRIIRYWWSMGNMTKSRIGKFFDVSYSAIDCIVRRKTWKHI